MASAAGEFQQYPGRYKLDEVIIRKIDTTAIITSMVIEFNIFASIADVTNKCNVIVADNQNLLGNYITPGDIIEINVSYADVSHTYEYVITSFKSIVNSDRTRGYMLECVSPLAFNSQYSKISRSYEGLTSDIATTIFNDYASELEQKYTSENGTWDLSLGRQTLVIPNLSPLHAIKTLAQRSRAVNDNVRFMFFQNSRQGYNFMPIEKSFQFYGKKPPVTYVYNRETYQQNDKPNSQAVMETILNIDYHDSFDMMNAFKSGKLASRRHNIDIFNKRQDIIDYNYWSDFDSKKRLNDLPLWTEPESFFPGRLQYDVVMSNTHDDVGINKVNDTSNLKVSSLDNTQMITIIVKGNQVVDVSHVVEVKIPSPEPKSDNMKSQFDLKWSGNYYVVAKRDMYNREGKQTALTLAKESSLRGI